jgi:hypothetical protein
MTYSVDIIAQQLFKTIKGFNHAIVLFTDDGQKTTDPNDARRFYAKDIQMMVNFVVDETTNEIVVNLSKDSDVAELQPMLSSIRNLANRYIIEYTVKTFGKSISPKDFAYQAKNTIEETMASRRNQTEATVTSEISIPGFGSWNEQSLQKNIISRATNIAKAAQDGNFRNVAHHAKILLATSKAYNAHMDSNGVNESDANSEISIPGFGSWNEQSLQKNIISRATNIAIAAQDGNFRNVEHHAKILLATSKAYNAHMDSNEEINELDCWDGYKKQGTKKGTGKNKDKRVNNCVPEDVNEGFSGWAGSARKSVNELGDARIIVKHKRSVDEEKRGARTRQIESIFIENSDGERFKFPSTNVTAAKAMARHVKEGGVPFDDFGQHIYGIMEELNQLKTFHRKNKRNDFFEDAAISEEIGTHIGNLRSSLKSMSGKNGYNKQFESFSKESENVSQERIDELKDETTTTYFDESIAAALPYVARIIETLRGRQTNESAVVEFARQVMGSETFSLSEACDDDDLDSPELQNYKDQLDEISAWSTYLAPRMQNEELAGKMTHMAENIGTVGAGHARMAMSAINVIRQHGQVAEASCIADEKNDVGAAENAKINETFDKYTVRKIFGV